MAGNRDESYSLALTLANAADDRKGGDIVIFKVSDVTFLADYFVIVSGFSRTQVRALGDYLESEVEQRLERAPLRKEGEDDRSWIVLDYGEVIAHIMLPDTRDYYNLEAFWGHSEKVAFEPSQV
ncbi:MAG: ribosome silencing factor [Cyanobacteria bacterium P01_F01_bin.42]